METQETLRTVLESVVRTLDAESGAVFWGDDDHLELAHTLGAWTGETHLSVPLESQGLQVGRLSLSARRAGLAYTPLDREVLQQTANLVARAVSLVRPPN